MSQLKPQDLRIGNYVKVEQDIYEELSHEPPTLDCYFKVKELTERSIYIYNQEENVGHFDDGIIGIPLTEEILLMAGFNKVKNSKESHLHKETFNWYSSMAEYIEIEHDNGISVSRQDIECKFLNQLQNLFYSIYNEELKINLK